VYLALLATRGRDEHRVHSPPSVEEQRAPRENHLVVRVGMDGHDRVLFVRQVGSPCAKPVIQDTSLAYYALVSHYQ
jgi:hypothetical protein